MIGIERKMWVSRLLPSFMSSWPDSSVAPSSLLSPLVIRSTSATLLFGSASSSSSCKPPGLIGASAWLHGGGGGVSQYQSSNNVNPSLLGYIFPLSLPSRAGMPRDNPRYPPNTHPLISLCSCAIFPSFQHGDSINYMSKGMHIMK